MIGRLWPFVVGSVALGLDAYVIAGLLPAMASSLHASESTVGLSVAAFTGAYAIAGPLLAGFAGRNVRGSLMTALVVFTLANVATAASSGHHVVSRVPGRRRRSGGRLLPLVIRCCREPRRA